MRIFYTLSFILIHTHTPSHTTPTIYLSFPSPPPLPLLPPTLSLSHTLNIVEACGRRHIRSVGLAPMDFIRRLKREKRESVIWRAEKEKEEKERENKKNGVFQAAAVTKDKPLLQTTESGEERERESCNEGMQQCFSRKLSYFFFSPSFILLSLA